MTARAGIALSTFLAVGLAAGGASAQLANAQCDQGDSSISPVKGTVGEATLEAATTRSNQTYGAAWLAQDRLAHIAEGVRRTETGEKTEGAKLASQDGPDKPGLFFSGFSMSTTSTFGAMRIPVCREGSNVVSTAPVDLISGGLSYSVGLHRNVHAFYAAGVTMRVIGFEGGGRAGLAAAPLVLAAYSPVAILKRRFETNTGIMIDFDYIVGLNVVSGKIGSVAVGYAGSQGVFSNLTEAHVRAFVGAVVDDFARGISNPYLAAGFSSLDWVLSDAAIDILGHTKLFGRRQLQAPPPPSDLIARTEDERPKGSRFSTINVEQTDIMGVVDVILRATIEPKPDLFEASLGYHKRWLADQFGVFIRAGVVKLPNLWFYGVAGGYKPRFEAGAAIGKTLPGRHVVEVAVGINDAEVLSVFPYAYNAVQFRFRIGI